MLEEGAHRSVVGDDSEGDIGFGALETARGRLPLAALDVTGRIDGLLSQLTVRQTFVNATTEPLEATYIFPLPDRAAVTRFRMEVAGRVVEGVLKERGEARRDYTRAIEQGHRASIAEEERPGVFTLRVGNLMPGDVATIELALVGTLPYSEGEVTFRFPLVVAPRYIPGMPLDGASVGSGTAVDTHQVPDASRISPPVLLPGFPNPVRLSLAIDVYGPIRDPRVSLFTVWGEEHDGMRRLIVRPGERLDRDFIMRFRLADEKEIRTSLSLHPDAADSDLGTFALSLVPPDGSAALVSSRPRDVVFLLDRSGSMSGWKIVAARRALARMIDTLTAADRFAVMAFDDTIESPSFASASAGLVAATDRNRFRTVEFLAKLEAGGGTEITEPLDRGVALLSTHTADRERILVLVTDGQVGNEDHVLRTLGGRLANIRVFTLGIDQAVNEGFLHRLAELGQGGGGCELVESEDRLDAVMDAIHRRIGAPVVSDMMINLAVGGLLLETDSQVPARPSVLFAGSPLLVLGRYRGCPSGASSVSGTLADGRPWHTEVAPCVRENPAIAAAWARGKVRQLEDDYAAGGGDRDQLERAIIFTSLKFGVLCRFTAYVAVDRTKSVNEGGEVHQITQAVEWPAGWAESAMPAFPGAQVLEDVYYPCQPESGVLSSFDLSRIVGGMAGGRRNRSTQSRAVFSMKSPRSSAGAPLPPSANASSGDTPVLPDGYVALRKISEDDHGSLHEGRSANGKPVMIRIFKTPVSLSQSMRLGELERLLRSLVHPAILPILKLLAQGQDGPVIAVVSPYVDDSTLVDWMTRSTVVDHHQAARMVLTLTEAIGFATARGVVHGRLAPRSIMIGDDEAPRVAGFELAPLNLGLNAHSPEKIPFLAPECLHDPEQAPTPRADVYSLGMILEHLMANVSVPRVGRKKTPAPSIPAELEAICRKATAPDPQARYADAGQLADALRGFLASGSSVAPTSAPAPPTARKKKRQGFWK
jgi:Ca-activated chloride channel family protein